MTVEPKAQPARPIDAVEIAVAARLIGLSGERVRQLIRGGYATSAGRGHVRLPSLLAGYVRFLKEQAGHPESEGAARGHDAKAELIAAATTRRRDELLPRAEAEAALDAIRDVATRHLRSLTKRRSAARGLPAAVVGKIGQETEVALIQISDAHAAAVKALRTGDFTQIGGGS
jgi:hypothetical protein